MMKEKFEAVKNHLKKHKAAYIAGGTGLIIGAAGAYFLSKGKAPEIQVVKPNNALFNWNNFIVNPDSGPGHPGNKIRHVESGDVFRSQKEAAKALNLSANDISRQVNGEKDHVKGNHFAPVHAWSFGYG